MAERIETVGTVRLNRLYAWEEWADGSAWLIRRGEDFTCMPSAMRQNLISYACRKGLAVTTHITQAEPDVVRFQFSRKETA